MSRQDKEVWVCDYCGGEFHTEKTMNACYLGHDVVFVGMERQEWKEVAVALLYAHYQGIYVRPTLIQKLLNYKIGVSL